MPIAWIVFAALAQGQVPKTVAPSFSMTVLRDFDAWDGDHDGALAAVEVDRAALDPQFHGEDAAALAALHAWLVVAKDPPRLTKDWFISHQPVKFSMEKGTPAGEAKKLRKAYATTPGSLQGSFTGALRRLSRGTQTEVFTANGPAMKDIRQGALGNCYMLAPLGAVAYRDPAAVKGMITMDADGYTVRFGDGKNIKVAGLTDAERAMGGAATGEGLWIRIVEKAYGSRKFAEGETGIARDSMNGGNPGVAGKAFTGHAFTSVKLVGDYTKTVSDADLDERLKKIRDQVPNAIAEKRLILAGTPSDKPVPKSINGKHAYAVLAYDATTDRITIWNPHGNDFTPKGDEGPDNGYARKDGVFAMPLPMFARAFSRIYFEKAGA